MGIRLLELIHENEEDVLVIFSYLDCLKSKIMVVIWSLFGIKEVFQSQTSYL